MPGITRPRPTTASNHCPVNMTQDRLQNSTPPRHCYPHRLTTQS